MKVSLDRNVNIKKLSGVNKYSLVHIPISNKHVHITDKSISLYLINARSEAGKAVSICEHIIDKSVDILAITETCCVREMVYILMTHIKRVQINWREQTYIQDG